VPLIRQEISSLKGMISQGPFRENLGINQA
jgi:hypothetical protein